ncbi:hypothetical protein IC608_16060 [Devosia sp. PTR5]|uniref:Uncharacterized protein n=1 Tax=Devosia oryzisoli TaxID=2774138 RepID=A0A927FW06_9HYPH|nr:hypothetical protein [Devosia oryzisoli]
MTWIYFNENLRAFTIVQYKAMALDPDGTPYFATRDNQLAKEIARMEAHLAIISRAPKNSACEGFRLLENPFYIKLCPRVQFEVAESSMIRGMYLPLDYFTLLTQDPMNRGSRGAGRLDFENVPRYFDNTSFISLVQSGWIGTTIVQSELLGELVREIVQTGRAVTIATAVTKAGQHAEL